MPLPHVKIFNCACQDLDLLSILGTCARYSPELKEAIFHRKESILPVLEAYYRAWFFQLTSRLNQDRDIEPQYVFKYLKSFGDGDAFLPQIRGLLARCLVEACNTLLHVQDLYSIPVLEENIRQPIESTLKRASTFEAVYEEIRNNAQAAARIFPQLSTPYFEQAYQMFKQAFQHYVEANVLAVALSQESLEMWSNRFHQMSSPLVLCEPCLSGGTLFHKLCQEGSDILLSQALRELAPFDDVVLHAPPLPTWQPKLLNYVLFNAAKKGDVDLIKQCFKMGAQIESTGSTSKKTALQIAAEAKQLPAVQELLKAGASLSRQSEGLFAPLHLALKLPINFEILQALLEQGSDVNEVDRIGDTALHYAVQANSLDAVSILLSYGAILESRDAQGNTPLHRAAAQGQETICSYLVAQGIKVGVTNQLGYTAAAIAKSNGHKSLSENLSAWKKEAEQNRREAQERQEQRLTNTNQIIEKQRRIIQQLQYGIIQLQNDLKTREQEIAALRQSTIYLEENPWEYVVQELRLKRHQIAVAVNASELSFMITYQGSGHGVSVFPVTLAHRLDKLHKAMRSALPDFRVEDISITECYWKVKEGEQIQLLINKLLESGINCKAEVQKKRPAPPERRKIGMLFQSTPQN